MALKHGYTIQKPLGSRKTFGEREVDLCLDVTELGCPPTASLNPEHSVVYKEVVGSELHSCRTPDRNAEQLPAKSALILALM